MISFTRYAATAAICVAASALGVAHAQAMAINPNGMGQVLIYPYYTVNKHQQTLISVTNPTSFGKAFQIAFREGYNGRYVFLQDIFLGPVQTWSATIGSSQDAGVPGDGVVLVSGDMACANTLSKHIVDTTTGGRSYQLFDDSYFTGTNADAGPTDDSRMHEGYVEVIELGEVRGLTQTQITPSLNADGPNCASVVPALQNPGDLVAPIGRLVGSAAVVDVAQGTYFSLEPVAIDGFRTERVIPPALIDLSAAGSSGASTVKASVLINGSYQTLSFPKSRAIDAVSALFMSTFLNGEFDVQAGSGASTDWILTFPTKHYYTDGHGLDPSPFTNQLGDSVPRLGYSAFNRDGFNVYSNWCGFGECPPESIELRTETQVLSFSKTNADLNSNVSNVVGSILSDMLPIEGQTAGWGAVSFPETQLGNSSEGVSLSGAPVIGAQVVNYVDTNAKPSVLANYSSGSRLRSEVYCYPDCN